MRDLVPIAEKIAAILIERRQTIAVAESSTGGLISAALLAVPGADHNTPLVAVSRSGVAENLPLAMHWGPDDLVRAWL